MFGGQVKSFQCNEHYVVVQQAQSLVVLDSEHLNYNRRIELECVSFGLIDQHLVLLGHDGIIHTIDINSGDTLSKTKQLIKNIQFAVFQDTKFLIFDGAVLYSYHSQVNQLKPEIKDLETKANSTIRASSHGNNYAISIDNMLLKGTQRFTHGKTITSLDIHEKSIAFGDEQGKITILDHDLKVISRPPQWHAHQVQCLKFDSEGEYLYSAGKEGVILQWHFQSQRKQLFPRQGNEIIDLSILNDRAFILLKALNTVKSLSLQGSNQSSVYKSVNDSQVHDNFYQLDLKSIITNAIPGQLQVIDIDKGKPQQIIDITKRNYISSSEVNKAHSDITRFAISNDKKFLACSVEVHGKQFLSQLHFFSLDDKLNPTPLSTITNESPIQGISSCYVEIYEQQIFLTWSQSSVRLWRVQKEATCLYEQTFTQVRNAHISQRYITVTLPEIVLQISLQNFKVEKEYSYTSLRNPIYRQNEAQLAIASGNELKLIALDLKSEQTIKLNCQKIKDIVFQDRFVYFVTVNQGTQNLIVYNTRLQKIVKAGTYQRQIKSIFIVQRLKGVDFFLVDEEGLYLKTFSIIEASKKKSSYIEEEEQQDDIQPEEQVDPRLVGASNGAQAMDQLAKQFERLHLASMGRRLKELQLEQFFPRQSHLLPNILTIAERVSEFINEDHPTQSNQSDEPQAQEKPPIPPIKVPKEKNKK